MMHSFFAITFLLQLWFCAGQVLDSRLIFHPQDFPPTYLPNTFNFSIFSKDDSFSESDEIEFFIEKRSIGKVSLFLRTNLSNDNITYLPQQSNEHVASFRLFLLPRHFKKTFIVRMRFWIVYNVSMDIRMRGEMPVITVKSLTIYEYTPVFVSCLTTNAGVPPPPLELLLNNIERIAISKPGDMTVTKLCNFTRNDKKLVCRMGDLISYLPINVSYSPQKFFVNLTNAKAEESNNLLMYAGSFAIFSAEAYPSAVVACTLNDTINYVHVKLIRQILIIKNNVIHVPANLSAVVVGYMRKLLSLTREELHELKDAWSRDGIHIWIVCTASNAVSLQKKIFPLTGQYAIRIVDINLSGAGFLIYVVIGVAILSVVCCFFYVLRNCLSRCEKNNNLNSLYEKHDRDGSKSLHKMPLKNRKDDSSISDNSAGYYYGRHQQQLQQKHRFLEGVDDAENADRRTRSQHSQLSNCGRMGGPASPPMNVGKPQFKPKPRMDVQANMVPISVDGRMGVQSHKVVGHFKGIMALEV